MKANLIICIEIILFSVLISLTSQAVFKVKLHKGCAKSPQGCPKKEKEEKTDNRKTGNSGIKSFLRTQVEHQTMVLSAQSTNDSYYYYNSFDTKERTSFNEALKNYINVSPECLTDFSSEVFFYLNKPKLKFHAKIFVPTSNSGGGGGLFAQQGFLCSVSFGRST